MRVLVLGLASLLWVAPVLAQTGEVPLPLPRPVAAAGEDTTETPPGAEESTEDSGGTETPRAGRVIKIEIIGEKKPGAMPPPVDYRARQADLQRQRLREARRARRAATRTCSRNSRVHYRAGSLGWRSRAR